MYKPKTRTWTLLALVALVVFVVGCRETPTPEPTLDLGDIGARGGSPRERICIDCGDESYIRDGGGLGLYSDYRGTRTVYMDGDGGVQMYAPTAQATGTPLVLVDNDSVANSIEVRNPAGTPVWSVGSAGGVSSGGTQTLTGDLDTSGSLITDANVEHRFLPSIVTATVNYTPTSGTVATVGANEKWIVHAVYAEIGTNFDCTGDDCTVDIGDGNDANGLLDLDDGELQTTDTEGTGAPAGWQGFMSTDTRGAYLANGLGFVYESTETIDYAVGGTDPVSGTLTVYVIYTRVD